MERLTVHARCGQVWLTAGLIAAIGILGCALLMLPGAILSRRAPDTLDLIMVPVLAGVVAGLWLVYAACTRRHGARELRITDETLTVIRPGGERIVLPWTILRRVRYSSADNGELGFETESEHVRLVAHGFDPRQWSICHAAILGAASQRAVLVDTNVAFGERITVWLNRTALGFVAVGGLGVTALAVWNVRNAAWLVLLVGALAVLVYLGSVTPHDGESGIPFAKSAGFYAAKLLAHIPLGVLLFGLLGPPLGFKVPNAACGWLYYVSNLLFFGGMAMALIVHGGWSARQYYQRRLCGVNRYHRRASLGALVLAVIGFALKCWNEG